MHQCAPQFHVPTWLLFVFWTNFNTDLIFVGRVEWDLSYFLVPISHLSDRTAGKLNALQQGRLGGITSHIPLQDW